MEGCFIDILNMSIAACILIAAVIIIRFFFRKAPKAFFCLLWAFVGFRLICPFSLQSVLCLIPDSQPVIEEAFSHGNQNTVQKEEMIPESSKVPEASDTLSSFNRTEQYSVPEKSPTPEEPTKSVAAESEHSEEVTVQKEERVNHHSASYASEINPSVSEAEPPEAAVVSESIQSADRGNGFIRVIPYVWITTAALMLIAAIIQYLRILFLLRGAAADENGVYRSSGINTPFILGIFRPRIFLPSEIPEDDIEYILAHERAHLKRLDHFWKPLGFVLLCIHWFNPLVWVAFRLFCKDIELACDELVIHDYTIEKRKEYSLALVNCSSKKTTAGYMPLAFGESGVKERVVNVLSYKKPTFWIILICILAAAGICVCLMTNPPARKEQNAAEANTASDISDKAASENTGETSDSSEQSSDNTENSDVRKKTEASSENDSKTEASAVRSELKNAPFYIAENDVNDEFGILLKKMTPELTIMNKERTDLSVLTDKTAFRSSDGNSILMNEQNPIDPEKRLTLNDFYSILKKHNNGNGSFQEKYDAIYKELRAIQPPDYIDLGSGVPGYICYDLCSENLKLVIALQYRGANFNLVFAENEDNSKDLLKLKNYKGSLCFVFDSDSYYSQHVIHTDDDIAGLAELFANDLESLNTGEGGKLLDTKDCMPSDNVLGQLQHNYYDGYINGIRKSISMVYSRLTQEQYDKIFLLTDRAISLDCAFLYQEGVVTGIVDPSKARLDHDKAMEIIERYSKNQNKPHEEIINGKKVYVVPENTDNTEAVNFINEIRDVQRYPDQLKHGNTFIYWLDGSTYSERKEEIEIMINQMSGVTIETVTYNKYDENGILISQEELLKFQY